jgi:hypothetical protein
MEFTRHVVLVLLALLASRAPAAAQEDKDPFIIPIPEKIERPTSKDAQGLLQFDAHKAEKCMTCKGRQVTTCQMCVRFDEGDCDMCAECKNTKEAKCRLCAGSGEMFDLLERAPCPSCFGGAVQRCFICNGRGKFPVQGGGKKPEKCISCKGTGAFKCMTCDGKRCVELPPLKPSVLEAKAVDIKKAIEAIDAVAAENKRFMSTGDGRKDGPAFAKVTDAGAKLIPVLKKVHKHFEAVSKEQTKGSGWTAYEEMVNNQVDFTKDSLRYFLEVQKRALQLLLARAEHNEPLQAAQKKK